MSRAFFLIKPSDFAMTLVLLLTWAVGSLADANLRGEGLPSASVEMPDASGPLDHAGPYAEEPNEAEATKPKAAKAKVRLGCRGILLSLLCCQVKPVLLPSPLCFFLRSLQAHPG